MTDAGLITVTAITAAVVVGIIEGVRRVSLAAETRVVRLGQNLGPRVEEIKTELAKGDPRIEALAKEVAELRGSVKVLLARETRQRRKTLAGVPSKVDED